MSTFPKTKQTSLALDTVFPCLTSRNRNTSARANATPSVEIFSGAVNIYMSNDPPGNSNKPTGKAQMTLLSSSPSALDIHTLNASGNWILFEEETATAVVRTTNVIDEGAI